MLRKWVALAVSTGVAVAALTAVKLLTKDEAKEEEKQDDEIKFINIDDDEPEDAEENTEPEVEEKVEEEKTEEEKVEEEPAETEAEPEQEPEETSKTPVEEEEPTEEPEAEEPVKEESKLEEKVYSDEVEEIAKLYPYLTKDFVEEQFLRNDSFNVQYPEDTLIRISHKAYFENPEVLEEYQKIAEENGYETELLNEHENVIRKKMFTEEGAILSDIYNVANQVACLKGEYKGYYIEA